MTRSHLTPDCGPHCWGKMEKGRYIESHCSCPKCHGKPVPKEPKK